MTYAVELFFDQESSSRLHALWASLQEIYGEPCRSELGVEPHLALAVFRSGEPPGCAELVEQLSRMVGPFELSFEGVDTFPSTEGVVYLRTAPCPALSQAHEQLHRLLSNCADQCLEYYLPGIWIPHTTVATDVGERHLSDVMEACIRSSVLRTVRVERVGGVRYRPAGYRHSFALRGSRFG